MTILRKFSRRPSKPPPLAPAPILTAKPSLPTLSSPPVSWPSNFVDPDLKSVPVPFDTALENTNPTTIPLEPTTPVRSFHRPFRTPERNAGGRIHTVYASEPIRALDLGVKRDASAPKPRAPRKPRAATPTFNLMICGGKRTGKTSLLRLLLDTADISASASYDQRESVNRFLKGRVRPTEAMQAVVVEICESRTDKLLLSVVDTPGLDFAEGRQLRVERQVSEIIKYVDALYAETMGEESKLVRKNKGDQHIHLCIYLIDPEHLLPSFSIRRRPSKSDLESQDDMSASPVGVEDAEDPDDEQLSVPEAELRVIQRLATRVNVLPVIARADMLTDEQLASAKAAIQRDLSAAGIDLGVFSSGEGTEYEPGAHSTGAARRPKRAQTFDTGKRDNKPSDEDAPRGRSGGVAFTYSADQGVTVKQEEPAAPVVKLRHSRSLNGGRLNRSRSRSRIRQDDRAGADVDEYDGEDLDPEGVPIVRFSAEKFTQASLTQLIPFAIILPQNEAKRAMEPAFEMLTLPVSQDMNGSPSDTGSPLASPAEIKPAAIPSAAVFARESIRRSRAQSAYNFLQREAPAVDTLRGVFVRRFRWGALDVLEPAHCDFAAMRTAVLTTHLRALKIRTREVLYESYRTEKLLARRITKGLSQDEAARLLEELGLVDQPSEDLSSRISNILDH